MSLLATSAVSEEPESPGRAAAAAALNEVFTLLDGRCLRP
jgi:hypothetical protein